MRLRAFSSVAIALFLLVPSFPVQAEEKDPELTGSVEVLYRSVSQDGSRNKYEEDFDGLESGGRLSNLSLDWISDGDQALDYASLELNHLGGDPYERSSFRLGRRNVFDLKIKHTSQVYLYDLFELVPAEDGALFDSTRTRTTVDFKLRASEKVNLFFNFEQGQRRGRSLFMKDISRDLFRLETPLDQDTERYSIGASVRLGSADLIFRHSLRRFENEFNNLAEGQEGLEETSFLRHYDWRQFDDSTTPLTSVKLNVPLSERVRLTASVQGTFLEDESLDSNIEVEQLGIGFNGLPFGGTCSISGATCASDADCAGGTGDVCVTLTGTSTARLRGDTTLIDLDLAVRVTDRVNLLLDYRSLERDLTGQARRDLDGDGVVEDVDGDGTPGTSTMLDFENSSVTATLEFIPVERTRIRIGVREADRELTRDGFGGLRDVDFESDGDQTLVFGVSTRPSDWCRINVDYEDGEFTQPFNAVAPRESERLRARASFQPAEGMRFDLSFLDFETRNTAPDIRDPGSNWDALSDGTNWSLGWWHQAGEKVQYLVRYAEQDVRSDVAVLFDTAGFFGVEPGRSIFDNRNDQIVAQMNFRSGEAWRGFLRGSFTESDGSNPLIGDVNGLVNDELIGQQYEDVEFGMEYHLPSGIYLGASIRGFDYEDRNGLLDYSGEILTLRGGTRF
ncbi:hypothetical protein ABI59_05165 [Acidobacteria bacterium Mor1]|nr:hypothetical protein ABI59_05165 [Acidobacteria bacterium Mor1]